ncbi:STAS domain-containing protein [Saccharothrix sp.]|uniref:STAS domain-containing protein n=1 Tax=Saccharothrix sp. TaxID=1873460 RepID=UPI002811AEE4|nr:STAS domain-containing protein [Saccharothrix sp.]
MEDSPVELSVVESSSDTVVLRIAGELDMATVPAATAFAHGHLVRTRRELVLDLSGVTFFASDGITLLLTMRSACQAVGKSLRVIATTPAVLHPLEVAGLREHFVITTDIEEVG